MATSQTSERRDRITRLTVEISRALAGEPIRDSSLALLISTELTIEQLLQHNPPDRVKARLQALLKQIHNVEGFLQ